MIKVDNIKLPVCHTDKDIRKKLEKLLRLDKYYNKGSDKIRMTYRILRQSIDARRKPEIFYVYSLSVTLEKEGQGSDIENRVIRSCRNKNISEYIPVDYAIPEPSGKDRLIGRPVIVGSGPAGLFCAYILCQKGYAPIVLERGECVDERKKSVEDFWNGGRLKPDSNVQFGEGGAGTFSDGKLNTGVNDKQGRNQYVLDTFVRFGADPGVAYRAKPHIGTDVLIDVVRNLRSYITTHGGCFMFDTRMTGIEKNDAGITGVKAVSTANRASGDDHEKEYAHVKEYIHTEILFRASQDKEQKINYRIDTNCVVLATGHSSRDTFKMLYDEGLDMVQKSFAVGLRIQHPQEMIDRAQYGVLRSPQVMNESDGYSDTRDRLKKDRNEGIPAADYRLSSHTSNGRSVYSFCMCPGGYVVNASSEENRLAINGMSYSGRDSLNANSAIIVSVDKKDFGSDAPLAGLEYQRRLEEKAYELGNGKIPVQTYGDFRDRVIHSGEKTDAAEANNDKCYDQSSEEPLKRRVDRDEAGITEPMFKGAYNNADLTGLFTHEINEALVESIDSFGQRLRGFDRDDALLAGVESRTSSPVRILRNEELESCIKGLYPCGEGAGYAGGITSAAMDGIRVAERILSKYKP